MLRTFVCSALTLSDQKGSVVLLNEQQVFAAFCRSISFVTRQTETMTFQNQATLVSLRRSGNSRIIFHREHPAQQLGSSDADHQKRQPSAQTTTEPGSVLSSVCLLTTYIPIRRGRQPGGVQLQPLTAFRKTWRATKTSEHCNTQRRQTPNFFCSALMCRHSSTFLGTVWNLGWESRQ